jgi:hypothetical protein
VVDVTVNHLDADALFRRVHSKSANGQTC